VYLGDRRGVRTPMQWSGDRNAGFSRSDPSRLFSPVIVDPVYHYEAVNVEAQTRVQTSLLNWMRRLISVRRRYPVFGRGRYEALHPANMRILVYTREDDAHTILCVVNLSRYVQPVHLDLSAYAGRVPVELIGEIPFPPIGENPYFLSLGPHAFFWFRLDDPLAPSAGGAGRSSSSELPR
jgi:maltose alpha-D-glucosyltransferase/alpha-amylase